VARYGYQPEALSLMKITNCRPVSREELERIASLPEPDYGDRDHAMLCDVEPRSLRDHHGVFKRAAFNVKLCKGMQFGQLLARDRERIDMGDYPEAEEIRQPTWSRDAPPITVLRTTENGECYVYDGEKRVLHACYHQQPTIRAFVLDVPGTREIVEEWRSY
jgi:hypothetical protein